ncbi:MAG: Sporulation stage 0, Spo0E-like regulatory phosphatase [Pelosinus sp.]|jgi:hypothetical protein|nr:Sporulation stage 0, Spo0E-like regulatory phosphatase [Pelosinus sp.]
MSLGEIVAKIEVVRQQLNEMGGKQCLVDAKVIEMSQQLDNLIVTYQKLLNQKADK